MFKIVRVQYTVKQEYVAANKRNIESVVNNLRKIDSPGIKYSVYLLDDGKTFMHFSLFETEEAQKVLNGLESFKQFQAELKTSGPEVPPKVDNLSLVGSSYDIF